MPVIEVVERFVLTLEGGIKRTFEKGRHDVEEEIAKHWYVQAHSTIVPPPAAAAEPTDTTVSPSAAPDSEPAANPSPPKKKT